MIDHSARPEGDRAADKIIEEIENRFPNWRSYRDLIDCIDVTLHHLRSRSWPSPAPPQPAPDAMREAARRFVDRLDYVHTHPAYKAVWEMAQMHSGVYRGPSYANDLSKLRDALSAPAPPADGARQEAEMQIDALRSLQDTEGRDIDFVLSQLEGGEHPREVIKFFRNQLIVASASAGWRPSPAVAAEPERELHGSTMPPDGSVAPPVRGDREAIAVPAVAPEPCPCCAGKMHLNGANYSCDKNTSMSFHTDDLSLPVQSGAGERT